MQTQPKNPAFTVLELLVVIVVTFCVVVVFLPGSFSDNRYRARAERITCVNNLKITAVSFRMWAQDNNEKYPMQSFTNATGALLFADATNGFRYSQALSNELGTPKILVCPADTKRKAATNFTTDFNGTHISYFVGLDGMGDETQPAAMLMGDRNITNGQPTKNGILELTTNQNIGWTAEIHQFNGNIGFADGSVQQLSSARLREAVTNTGLATNRLLLP